MSNVVCPFHDVQSDLLAARTTDAVPALEKPNTVIKKKKSSWFRRNTEEKDRDYEDVENQLKKKRSMGLPQIPGAWQALDDRIKTGASPLLDMTMDMLSHDQKDSESSIASEFSVRHSSSAAARTDGALRKGLFGFLGKKTKEERAKKPMELGGEFVPNLIIHVSSYVCSHSSSHRF